MGSTINLLVDMLHNGATREELDDILSYLTVITNKKMNEKERASSYTAHRIEHYQRKYLSYNELDRNYVNQYVN